jgi:hypothetical protein
MAAPLESLSIQSPSLNPGPRPRRNAVLKVEGVVPDALPVITRRKGVLNCDRVTRVVPDASSAAASSAAASSAEPVPVRTRRNGVVLNRAEAEQTQVAAEKERDRIVKSLMANEKFNDSVNKYLDAAEGAGQAPAEAEGLFEESFDENNDLIPKWKPGWKRIAAAIPFAIYVGFANVFIAAAGLSKAERRMAENNFALDEILDPRVHSLQHLHEDDEKEALFLGMPLDEILAERAALDKRVAENAALEKRLAENEKGFDVLASSRSPAAAEKGFDVLASSRGPAAAEEIPNHNREELGASSEKSALISKRANASSEADPSTQRRKSKDVGRTRAVVEIASVVAELIGVVIGG